MLWPNRWALRGRVRCTCIGRSSHLLLRPALLAAAGVAVAGLCGERCCSVTLPLVLLLVLLPLLFHRGRDCVYLSVPVAFFACILLVSSPRPAKPSDGTAVDDNALSSSTLLVVISFVFVSQRRSGNSQDSNKRTSVFLQYEETAVPIDPNTRMNLLMHRG